MRSHQRINHPVRSIPDGVLHIPLKLLPHQSRRPGLAFATYDAGRIIILDVLTHEEYDREQWKK